MLSPQSLNPVLPMGVTYDVTPPNGVSGAACFEGVASFAGIDVAVTGDLCIAVAVPTLSEWALIVFGVGIMTAGAIILRSKLMVDSSGCEFERTCH